MTTVNWSRSVLAGLSAHCIVQKLYLISSCINVCPSSQQLSCNGQMTIHAGYHERTIPLQSFLGLIQICFCYKILLQSEVQDWNIFHWHRCQKQACCRPLKLLQDICADYRNRWVCIPHYHGDWHRIQEPASCQYDVCRQPGQPHAAYKAAYVLAARALVLNLGVLPAANPWLNAVHK